MMKKLPCFDDRDLGVSGCFYYKQKVGEMASDAELAGCRDQETKVWDKRLNEAYRHAQGKIEKDAVSAVGPRVPGNFHRRKN